MCAVRTPSVCAVRTPSVCAVRTPSVCAVFADSALTAVRTPVCAVLADIASLPLTPDKINAWIIIADVTYISLFGLHRPAAQWKGVRL